MKMIRIASILCIALAATAMAADEAIPPQALALQEAGFRVEPVKGGGFAVEPKADANISDERWKLMESLGNIKRFSCGGKEFDDAALARLAKLKSIESIFLNGPSITDAGLSVLKDMPNLSSFGVHHSTVLDGRGVEALKDMPSLTSIEFGGSMIGDAGARSIAKLTQLKEVRLGHCRNTRASLAALASLPNLEVIELTPNWDPSAYTVSDLAVFASCPHLREIELHDMLLPFVRGTEMFARFQSLKTLKLYWCHATPRELAQLRSALPNVKIDYDHEAAPERVADAERRLAEFEKTQAR